MDTLRVNETLVAGQELRSANSHFSISIRSNNLVLSRTSDDAEIWSSGTTGSVAAQLTLSDNGNLELFMPPRTIHGGVSTTINLQGHEIPRTILWNSNTGGRGARYAKLDDDGRFVLYGEVPYFPGGGIGTSLPDLTKPAEMIPVEIWSVGGSMDRLEAGDRLRPGQVLRSPRGHFSLAIQPDGTLLLYRSRDRLQIWSARGDTSNVELVMQDDGNLVLRVPGYHVHGGIGQLIDVGEAREIPPQVVWASDTAGCGRYVSVQDDGRLVIYSQILVHGGIGTEVQRALALATTVAFEVWSTPRFGAELIRQTYERIGGIMSELGLPIAADGATTEQPDIRSKGESGWVADFRGGVIELADLAEGETVATQETVLKVWWVGLECRVRQEKVDEIMGTVGVMLPSQKHVETFHVPEQGEPWRMGEDGTRTVSVERLIYTGAPADVVLFCTLVEHDSGDIDEYKRRVAEALTKTAQAGLGAAGMPAEATAADSGFIGDISLGLTNAVFSAIGADDDPFTTQALRVPHRDIQIAIDLKKRKRSGIPSPFPEQTMERADTPGVILHYNVGPVILSGVDQGGDRGEYGFYFRVQTIEVHSIL